LRLNIVPRFGVRGILQSTVFMFLDIFKSNDPESYAGGSVATGRVSLAGQVKGDEPD
jgi:hypothetical protein